MGITVICRVNVLKIIEREELIISIKQFFKHHT